MQFCQRHWDGMRQAVEARGMSHLVARDGQEAIENEVLRLQGDTSPATWDPLMAANWSIMGRVVDRLGHSQGPQAAIAAFADPDFCPLCAVQRSYDWWGRDGHPPAPKEALDAQGWIDSCMDAMRAHAVEVGLISEARDA